MEVFVSSEVKYKTLLLTTFSRVTDAIFDYLTTNYQSVDKNNH